MRKSRFFDFLTSTPDYKRFLMFILLVGGIIGVFDSASASAQGRVITADVVALDQHFFWNRLGTVQPHGMIYALKSDIVPIDPTLGLIPGNVKLRSDKRPRPMVLRMNVGDTIQINFTNLLSNTAPQDPLTNEFLQPATRAASVHVIGMELVNSITDDGSNVGTNPSSLVDPGQSITYTLYAEREGGHVMYSMGANIGGEGNGGTVSEGLFGAIIVEPAGSEWYRSAVTRSDFEKATIGLTDANGDISHPIINYNAKYPAGHPREGVPILNMLDDNLNIVHADIRAVITGPNAGRFSPGIYPEIPVMPDREQPFREFVLMYHDDIHAQQAFPAWFGDPVLKHTLSSVKDGHAFNYGTGGVGAEIIANRLGIGPMGECVECKYEEFFLSAWTVGDPAMIVDVPANATVDVNGVPNGQKATKALYPDDPSNVYNSYMMDHVKFRLLHAGPKEHHIHHQHAHQWLYTPDSDNSAYLDSQMIGPGAAFTLDMAYNGSGNRNMTVGDSIFHCHFYPHFAQGMWAMWRVHDVFEAGTVMEVDPADGLKWPAQGSRALPDAEIVRGTPIPAVVPLPTIAMAPLPEANATIVDGQVEITGTGNPGFPFFIPGIAGHRPPHPPIDTTEDGGLPRHIITGGTAYQVQTRLDFTKELVLADAIELDDNGEPAEIAAMAFHAQRTHSSVTPSGDPADFTANGLPSTMGAPFADPCIDDSGNPVGTPRTIKAADIQIDMVYNKAGWHFPQARMISLQDDVDDVINGNRTPEPLFVRANSGDCITLEKTNLTPKIYEMDDFQVRTPTDIIGQHIHLVKFDVMGSDGSANGWNYEDGSFSPGEVRERIEAINHGGGLTPVGGGVPRKDLVAKVHPVYGAGPNDEWIGATTTIQRWYADEVLNLNGDDRTLRSVYTHDHYAPSTHQQVGLYAGLIIEPKGSTWHDPVTGVALGGRGDGGPTSWRADIRTVNPADSYREFMFEVADFAIAYYPNNKQLVPYTLPPLADIVAGDYTSPLTETGGYADPPNAVLPPGVSAAGLPNLYQRPEAVGGCPGGVDPPCPEAISAFDPGAMLLNYRNEPLALRIRNPQTNSQASGDAGDSSLAFRSDITRADPDLNNQHTDPSKADFIYDALTPGMQPKDPFTPLIEAYSGDNIQIRTLVGSQEEGHNMSLHGIKWKLEPREDNSGWRNSQSSGISEHFEMEFPLVPVAGSIGESRDHLYQMGSAVDDLWMGAWGIIRAYETEQPHLQKLPNNNNVGPVKQAIPNAADFNGPCPVSAPVRSYNVTAASVQDILPGGTLVYNERLGITGEGPLHDPTAIMFVYTDDIDNVTGQIKPNAPIEPLILRANAGDCIEVTLNNTLPATVPDAPGYNSFPLMVDDFNANDVRTSSRVGLHPQLVAFDVTRSDGASVGFNPDQTVGPNGTISYRWYAGDLVQLPDGSLQATPVEFGATNLMSSDRLKHSNKGAIGALIIEPQGSTWETDEGTRASATITRGNGLHFREFVTVFQNDVNLQRGDGTPVELLADADDPHDTAQKAINYRSEPLWFRMGYHPSITVNEKNAFDYSDVLTNGKVGGDPVTPVFTAEPGEQVYFRVVHPGGRQRNDVFMVHGHTWQQEPYVNGSKDIGFNPLSEWEATRIGHGPTYHFDAPLRHGAGGRNAIPGDYLYRNFSSYIFDGGQWGIFRVAAPAAEPAPILCDVVVDGQVDINDLMAMFGVMGQSASPGDPMDYNSNGTIDFGDVNGCVTECTNPGCSP